MAWSLSWVIETWVLGWNDVDHALRHLVHLIGQLILGRAFFTPVLLYMLIPWLVMFGFMTAFTKWKNAILMIGMLILTGVLVGSDL